MAYVVKAAKVPKGDINEYLVDGWGARSVWGRQKAALRFETTKEAFRYVRKNGWPRKNHGLRFMRLKGRKTPKA